MFRIVRVSASRLQGRYPGGSSRLSRTIRYYSKEQQRSELCPPPPPKKPHTGTAFTLGALALASGAIIGYAKYDPDFRCVLTEYLPFTDGIIKFVFQEDKSYYDALTQYYEHLRNLVFPEQEKVIIIRQVEEVEKDYKPPSLVLPAVAKDAKIPDNQYSEVRLESRETEESEPDVKIVDPRQDIVLPDTHPKKLAELEKDATEAAKTAVLAYNKAVFALKNYMVDIELIIEQSVNEHEPRIWDSLKQKTDEKDSAIQAAEREASQATADFMKLRDLLTNNEAEIPDSVKDQALRNIEEVTEDLITAKKELDGEKKRANVTEKYWKRVQDARKHFGDELEILFPNINIEEKHISISEGELDLFVLHAMAKVLYYQKELHKLETVGSERLRYAVEAAKKGGLDVLTTEQICNELEKEKRLLEMEFHKKCLKLRHDSETELRNQLKSQSQAFSDHLADALKAKEFEVEKKLSRTFDEKLTEERCLFKEQLAAMIGRLRGLDHAIKARKELEKHSHKAQVLWAACQALFRAVKAGCPGVPWSEQIRPLDPEINAVRLAAADNDELVKAVLEGIPASAKKRGVYPEDALRERFIKVEKVARGVALVPENGGRLHLYFLSYLQSFLLLKAANPIPQSELNDDETDFSKLSTNDILQRARYWLDRGDFSQTLKYMNLLQGASRAVSRQWMEETRILLETQQAANTLMAHATASGLMHL